MPKPYTPEEAKKLILERGFSPLEPYPGNHLVIVKQPAAFALDEGTKAENIRKTTNKVFFITPPYSTPLLLPMFCPGIRLR